MDLKSFVLKQIKSQFWSHVLILVLMEKEGLNILYPFHPTSRSPNLPTYRQFEFSRSTLFSFRHQKIIRKWHLWPKPQGFLALWKTHNIWMAMLMRSMKLWIWSKMLANPGVMSWAKTFYKFSRSLEWLKKSFQSSLKGKLT